MKPTLSFIFASLALSSGLTFASDNFGEGDLALAFYQTIGGVVQSNTYVVNLGQASLYRENTQNDVSITSVNTNLASGNIDADLDATFGTDWADAGNVTWVLIGGVSAGGAPNPYFPGSQPTLGDPARTSYLSKARASLNSSSTAPGTTLSGTLSSTNRGTLSTNVVSFLSGASKGIDAFETNTATSGSNLASAILPKSNINTIDEFLPPATNTHFGVAASYDPRQTLSPGPISGTAGVQGALDIYRIIHTTTGADLTAGASAGNASVGVAQFIGTITLSAAGDLKIVSLPSSASNYSSWASTNGVTGGVNGDSDNDGFPNSIEYALATNLNGPDGSLGTFTGGLMSFTKRPEAVANGDVTYQIEESDDLNITDPWAIVAPTSDTNSIITYLLQPPGPPKKFARLRITVAP
jgi:hypothetical protein